MPSDESRPLVLVVEDNPANLLLACAVLARAGYRTLEACSAEEALDCLRSARPDLILMDIQLPGQDGLALTRQLKADPATAAIPVVALTAHAMVDDEQKARAAGCDGYLTKPINTRALPQQVAAVLRARSGGAPAGESPGDG